MTKLFVTILAITCMAYAVDAAEPPAPVAVEFSDEQLCNISDKERAPHTYKLHRSPTPADHVSIASDKDVCVNGCKSRNPGGCVLLRVETWREQNSDGEEELRCHCIWLCMPRLKYFI